MREAYINEIGERNFKYFVQDLVKIARDDPNLKVACRAEAIIEKLTEEKFEDFPPYNEVQRWWDEKGKKDVKYSNSLHRLSEVPKKFGIEEFDSIIPLFEKIINSQQGMCRSHSSIAEMYLSKHDNLSKLSKGDKDKAKEHLKIAIEECDGQNHAIFRYASLLYDEGKKSDVIGMLSKAKPYVPDVIAFEKLCRSTFPNITNEDGFKKLFEVK